MKHISVMTLIFQELYDNISISKYLKQVVYAIETGGN